MPQSSWYRFNALAEHLAKGVHNFSSHTIKIYLTNSTPDQANHSVKADLAGITEQNGYSEATLTVGVSRTNNVASITCSGDVQWTASGGSFGPFRYVVMYNDTPTTPADPLIAYWDYGQSITVQNGESFTVDLPSTLCTVTAS
ncbi:MAG: hypothetical protein QXZ28_02860 [Candidatus Methanomethylicaceae archaeon]